MAPRFETKKKVVHHHYIDWKRLEEKPDNSDVLQAILMECKKNFTREQMLKRSSCPTDATVIPVVAAADDQEEGPKKDGLWTSELFFEHAKDYLVATLETPAFKKKKIKKWLEDDFAAYLAASVAKEEGSSKGQSEGAKRGGGGSSVKAAPDVKKKNKKGVSRRDDICKKNLEALIERDLKTIQFQKKYPQKWSFHFDATFGVMMIEWCARLFLQEDKNADRYATIDLDALLSYDRFIHQLVPSDDRPDKSPASPPYEQDLQSFCKYFYDTCLETKWNSHCYTLLFKNPRYMVQSFFQCTREKKDLYPEQRRVLEKVCESLIQDKPLLMGDRMPPGTGKTFLAVPIAQAVQALRIEKCILFACPNELVRNDVGMASLLGCNLHLWMGRQCINEDGQNFFLIRPYKRCFPSNWKKIYKEEDRDKDGTVEEQINFYKEKTKKLPDIMVVDLPTCHAILSNPDLNPFFISYLDEVVSDDRSNEIVSKILTVLPRQSVLVSAILFPFEEVPSLKEVFYRRHSLDRELFPEDQVVFRIEANHLTISCSVVDPDGCLCFPHHFIHKKHDLPMLVRRIEKDPLIGRMYSPEYVYDLIDHLQRNSPIPEVFKERWNFDHYFRFKSDIHHVSIRNMMLTLLLWIEEQSADNDTHFELLQNFRPKIFTDKPTLEGYFTEQASEYRGKTLMITKDDDIYPLVHETTKRFMEGCPVMEDLEKEKKNHQEAVQKLEKSLDNKKKKGNERVDKMEQIQLQQEIKEFQAQASRLKWPLEYTLQNAQHILRFYKGTLTEVSLRALFNRLPLVLPEYYHSLDELTLTLLYCGLGIYDTHSQTLSESRLVMAQISKLACLWSGSCIVFGTNVEGLSHLFIAKDFGLENDRDVLYQLIGRVGRIGMSYSAMILVDDWDVLRKIMSFYDVTSRSTLTFEDRLASHLRYDA